jgi:hypothetical protein
MRNRLIHRIGLAWSMVALVAVAIAQPVSAASTSTVSDPNGDAFFEGTPLPRPGYQDIVQAMVASGDSGFSFVMDVAAPIPSNPALPPEAQRLSWQFVLNTNPATAPKGYPFAQGSPAPAEYLVMLIWDGTAFTASLIDRTPLLTEGQAAVTPITFSFSADRSEVTLSASAAAIGRPSSFGWRALTMQWASPFGTSAFFHVDQAPNFGFASWAEG